MFVIDDLKLNRFKFVRIPSNREYFSKLGFCSVSPSLFTGDESISAFQSKLDSVKPTIEEYDEYCSSFDVISD